MDAYHIPLGYIMSRSSGMPPVYLDREILFINFPTREATILEESQWDVKITGTGSHKSVRFQHGLTLETQKWQLSFFRVGNAVQMVKEKKDDCV